MILDVKLTVPRRENNVFLAILGSGVPEPVLVMLLSHMNVNDSVLIDVEEDDCEIELCKVYQEDIGDHECVAFFVAPVRTDSGIEYDGTFMAWIANGALVGLFRLVMEEGRVVGLEIGERWGESWTEWARKKNGRWHGTDGDDRIRDFVMHRLVSEVDDYLEDIAKA